MELHDRMAEKYRGLLARHGQALGLNTLVFVKSFREGQLVDISDSAHWGNGATGPALGTFSTSPNRVKAAFGPAVEIPELAAVLSFPRRCPREFLTECEYLEISTRKIPEKKYNVLTVSETASPLTWECGVVEIANELYGR
jgi:hypothetical protein